MNQNNLVDGIETQMRIEKGLKLLEFASQFYARRAYLRNCPLSVGEEGCNNQVNGQIMAQLNQFLADPEGQEQRRNRQPILNSLPSMNKKKASEDQQSNLSPSASKMNVSNSKGFGSAIKKKVLETEVTPKKVVKALVDMTKPKSVKIAQKVVEKVGSKIKQKKNSNKKEIEQSAVKVESPSIDQSEDSLPDVSSQEESISKMRNIEDSEEIQDVNLNHSKTKTLAVIKENSHESSIVSPEIISKNRPKLQGYDLSDFASIKNNTSVVSQISAKSFKKQVNPQNSFSCQFPSRHQKLSSKKNSFRQPELKSQNKHFLDKSISQIKTSKDRDSYITHSKIDKTELHILKELSDSYLDDENMKNLMKLQNMQLQENYLLNRMERRFQKCAKQIEQIRHITWEELRMPRRDVQFRRPNYAHCLQGIK